MQLQETTQVGLWEGVGRETFCCQQKAGQGPGTMEYPQGTQLKSVLAATGTSRMFCYSQRQPGETQMNALRRGTPLQMQVA